MIWKVGFMDNEQQDHAKLTWEVTKKQNEDKSRLKADMTKVQMFLTVEKKKKKKDTTHGT